MLTAKEHKHASKFISLILRHDPAAAGITLDAGGWANVPELLTGMEKAGVKINQFDLIEIVEADEKKRYTLTADGARIRANQGHSIPVDLGLTPQQPPEVLYHGTDLKAAELIAKEGILKMSRNHVHLSSDLATAEKVGRRHGLLCIFSVDTKRMLADGHKFYVSENGVWLTDYVPPQYLTVVTRIEA